ncbi:hypothetical protein M513_09307 [Trichuris suis]|uniref:Integrase catalytic domain-containing protein n=1 Tax=Trichuris suis TaxID=68888 RepID=A0A085LXZ4_9BILA|nr:hypothetical protein M513_09307 [Trichuris suis]
MATVGCIDPFDVDQPASWDAYVERLKFFFEANGIADDGKKRATLLSVCGLPALSIAKSVVSPKSLSDVSYDYIVRALQCHFIPKPSVIYQRFHFQRRLQRDGEGIATYIAEFRRLASDCNFGSNLEERLRDQFVCGLKDEDLQKRLLAHSELDLNDALREAVAAESASRQAKDIRSANAENAEIPGTHQIRKGTDQRPPKAAGSSVRCSCASCGGEHQRNQCRFRNAICRWCSRKGHIEKVCRSKRAHNGPTDSSNKGTTTKRAAANAVRHRASRSLTDVYEEGVCTVNVSYGRAEGHLRLYIAKGRRTSLLGSDWFDALGIRLVGIHQINSDPVGAVLQEFPDIFRTDFGEYTGPPVSLRLDPTVAPIQLKARRVPIALVPKIDAEIDRLILQGIVEPTENAEWATPVVPVLKQNGEVRLCADYKCTINKALRQHPYPIPQVDRLLNSQAGGGIYAKLDLANAYHQIRVDDKSADAQTIVTHRGAFRVKRLQFGVCTAPGIFQSCMENLLRDLPGVTPYFDDILIKADSEVELAERLRAVFSRLRSAGLRVRKDKCLFGVRNVDFLGYRLDASGIHPTIEKVKAIHEAPTPKDKKELQGFLGLLNFYHNFLKDKATIAEPLHELLRGNTKWKWTQEHERAFKKIKLLLSDESLLVKFNETLPITLTCDASQYGIGAVLAHDMGKGREAPIAFYSRTMTPTERNYAQIDREALAIVSAVKKFHDYLYGHRFTIVTDHKPLLGLFAPSRATPQILSPRLLRWSQLLRAYDYELVYRPGNAISHADGLSRLPLPSTNIAVPPLLEVSFLEELPSPPLRASEIASMSARGPIISRVLNWVSKGWPSSSVEERFLPFVRRQHELSCHMGCLLWGNRVVVPEAAQSSKILICELRRVFATHGLPDTIVSDNGSPFTSSEFGEFLRRNAIRHARVAPYHPSSNGQAERMIQTAKDALRRMESGDLSQQLASFLLSQHTLPCVTTGRSPAELLMNRRLRSRLDRLHPDWSSEHKREIEDNAPKTKPRLLDINEPVLVRTFSPGQNWTPATITHSTGPVSYRAQTTDGKIVHRQVDHILKDYSSGAEHTEIGPAESSSPEQETERPNETNEQTPLVAVAPPVASRPRRNRRPPKPLQDYVI